MQVLTLCSVRFSSISFHIFSYKKTFHSRHVANNFQTIDQVSLIIPIMVTFESFAIFTNYTKLPIMVTQDPLAPLIKYIYIHITYTKSTTVTRELFALLTRYNNFFYNGNPRISRIIQ